MNYEFSKMNLARCEAPNGFNHKLASWSTSDWFVAIMGELGEAANVVKKLNRVRDGIPGDKQTPEELRQKLEHELADTYIYLDLICQSLDIDLLSAVIRTFQAKSKEIGYVPEPSYNGPTKIDTIYQASELFYRFGNVGQTPGDLLTRPPTSAELNVAVGNCLRAAVPADVVYQAEEIIQKWRFS